MNIVAMIPARGGSKGIKDKNITLVAGKPLIVHTFEAAKASKKLSRVIFSTDSPRFREIALENGIEAPFLRPPELAVDTTCVVDVMAHCVKWLKDNEGYRVDQLVTLYPTSPLRRGAQIDEALDAFSKSDSDCLVSVSMQKHHPYWSLDVDEKGHLSHYFGKEHIFYRRQDMPRTYEQNGAIYISPPENIKKMDRRSMTENTLAFVMDEQSSLNIDDPLDLVLANALFEAKQNAAHQE
jgi:CMP-N,N'-diacetyllegionaminic acid synthase